jgi:hypothetical protein
MIATKIQDGLASGLCLFFWIYGKAIKDTNNKSEYRLHYFNWEESKGLMDGNFRQDSC